MNSESDRLKEIFSQALQRSSAAEQEEYLAEACRGDAELRKQVQSLLAAHEQAGDFLGQTIKLPPPDFVIEPAGTMIGRYKLLEKIGEGGFGVVYVAEQQEPVQRKVALKIIKPGMDTREVIARFEAERQALALMDHPNIAKVLDGGTTEAKRPYFVMELVRGTPITVYCDQNNLPTNERLPLFVKVCQAVQHAHQKGVIHRDLKPSNVLVTLHDGEPVPKVIDFGVAKALGQKLTEKTLFTAFAQMIGTPAYMSPEQAEMSGLDVDTRSDVYSLGVLLYELLTGVTPFDKERLAKAALDEIRRLIRETEPPKPSTRLRTLGDKIAEVARNRQTEPATLSRLVRGDLDWIVMKCLEKDRTRRYETANGLARDVEHHLRAEPVSAAAPDLVYRAGKFVRRNRARLAFAGLVLVTVVLAVVGGRFALSYRSARKAIRTTGTNTVFSAAKSGDVEGLRRLLEVNPRLVRQCDADGSTALAYAAEAGKTNTLRLLLARGAEVDATNRLGWTALLQAAADGHASAVAALLEAGADPNHSATRAGTALILASLSGDVEVGRLLLAKGARVDAVLPSWGTAALYQAALVGHADFVELLLTNGARTDVKGAYGFTPLHAAASGMNAADAPKILNRQLQHLASSISGSLSAGPLPGGISNLLAGFQPDLPASVLRRPAEHRRAAELLLARKADLEATNEAGWTPLHVAALWTNWPVAEVLVTHHAKLNPRDDRGRTPLAVATGRGDQAIVTLLLDGGADPNLADNAGFSPLHTAVENGFLSVEKVLLAHHADLNLACPGGQTPLHTAAGRGDIESMRLLLDNDATLHALSHAGTPLAWATYSRKREAVKFLLARGAKADVASPQSGMTALHGAVIVGDPEVARLLLDAGARVDVSSAWHGTALNVAAAGRSAARTWLAEAEAHRPAETRPSYTSLGSDQDYLALIRMLLAAKANLNAREPVHERSPLHTAVLQGHAAAVDVLLEAGADVQAVDRLGRTALHDASQMDASALVISNIVARLLRAGASVEARDQFHGSPLHAAANAGNPVMAGLLLEAGARINTVGPNLCTPLQLAVIAGRRDVVKLLLAKGADLDWHEVGGSTALLQAILLRAKDIVALLLQHGADVEAGSADGSTALMASAELGDLGMINLLLEHGANINATSKRGWTPFLSAAKGGSVEAAILLLDHGARFDVADQYDATPLIVAVCSGRLEMVKFLLARGMPINARNNHGLTILHQAADRGQAEVAEFLLGRGLEVNSRSDNQYTALHYAANGVFTNEDHYVAVAKLLLAHGADVNARTRDNQTPLHRAAVWGHLDIVQLLLEAKADPDAHDSDGKTALDLAIAAKRNDCAEYLRKAQGQK